MNQWNSLLSQCTNDFTVALIQDDLDEIVSAILEIKIAGVKSLLNPIYFSGRDQNTVNSQFQGVMASVKQCEPEECMLPLHT